MSSYSENESLKQPAGDKLGEFAEHIHIDIKPRAWGFGHALGRFVRGYLEGEKKVFHWASARGLSPFLCRLVLIATKLIILAAVLYTSFWIALYAAAFWFIMGMIRIGLAEGPSQADDDDGWRDGHAGFGDYCGEYRVDPGRYDKQ